MEQIKLAPWLCTAKADIVELKQRESLSHALLLLGRDGGGHYHLANLSAQDLLCQHLTQSSACGECHSCQLMKAQTHPDFHFLDGRNETIKVDQIRHILQKVATKPQIGKAKVVFLAQAASMNTNAANAILKALEEPPKETFFLLTSDANSPLLPTIRSRCVLMSLPIPTEREKLAWFNDLGEIETGDLSKLFWVTEEPFTLLNIIKAGKTEIYTKLPLQLKDYLESRCSADDLLANFDIKHNRDFLNALSALMHHCICYSTGKMTPNLEVLRPTFDLLLSRLGIHKIMNAFQRLQSLVHNTGKTNLNMQMQIKAELVLLTK